MTLDPIFGGKVKHVFIAEAPFEQIYKRDAIENILTSLNVLSIAEVGNLLLQSTENASDMR